MVADEIKGDRHGSHRRSTLVTQRQFDPSDVAERARNDVVFSVHGTRRPFVDQPK